MSDHRDDATNRIAARFDGEQTEKNEGNDKNARNAKNSGNAQSAQSDGKSDSSVNAKNDGKAKNVKKDWNARSVYLSDDLDRKVSTGYKRLDLELEMEFGETVKKTRHFYPLVFELGLERMEELEPQELMERIERMEL
ncbi:hypothetical protein [Haladaptatus sp. NG-WS-4]